MCYKTRVLVVLVVRTFSFRHACLLKTCTRIHPSAPSSTTAMYNYKQRLHISHILSILNVLILAPLETTWNFTSTYLELLNNNSRLELIDILSADFHKESLISDKSNACLQCNLKPETLLHAHSHHMHTMLNLYSVRDS